jgi:hypothetical protein
MLVETTNNEIIIRLPKIFEKDSLIQLLNYFRATEIVDKAKGTEIDANNLAEELNTNWWKKNQKNYLPCI